MESGILKLNQIVISEIILEYNPGAITAKYATDSIKDIIEAGTTDLSNYDTLVHFTPIKYQTIWAVDLTNTFMASYDFNFFII